MTEVFDSAQQRPDPAELRNILREVTRDGEWVFSRIDEGLGAWAWMKWFDLRLHGDDPRFGYGRDEPLRGSVSLYKDLFRTLQRNDGVRRDVVQNIEDNAAAGLLFLLKELDEKISPDSSSEPQSVHSEVLYAILDLIGYIRVQRTNSRDGFRDILRKWLDASDTILSRSVGEVSTQLLCRASLAALAELQVSGGPSNEDVWEKWFEKDSYKLQAFAGMARATIPPEGWVAELLRHADEMEERGQVAPVQFPLHTLYMGDLDPEDVMVYLWDEAHLETHRTGNPRETWERLRSLLADSDANLLDYAPAEVAVEQRKQFRNRESNEPDSNEGAVASDSLWTLAP